MFCTQGCVTSSLRSSAHARKHAGHTQAQGEPRDTLEHHVMVYTSTLLLLLHALKQNSNVFHFILYYIKVLMAVLLLLFHPSITCINNTTPSVNLRLESDTKCLSRYATSLSLSTSLFTPLQTLSLQATWSSFLS